MSTQRDNHPQGDQNPQGTGPNTTAEGSQHGLQTVAQDLNPPSLSSDVSTTLDPEVSRLGRTGHESEPERRTTGPNLQEELLAAAIRQAEERKEAELKERIAEAIAMARREWEMESQGTENPLRQSTPAEEADAESQAAPTQAVRTNREGKQANLPQTQVTVETERKNANDEHSSTDARGRSSETESQQVHPSERTPSRPTHARSKSHDAGTLPRMRQATKNLDETHANVGRAQIQRTTLPQTDLLYSQIARNEHSDSSADEDYQTPSARKIKEDSAKRLAAYARYAEADTAPAGEKGQYIPDSEPDEAFEQTYGGFQTVPKANRALRSGREIPTAVTKVVKLPKVELSEKYSGKDDKPATLKKWAADLSLQLRANMVDPRSQFATIVALQNLTGPAGEWAAREVQDALQASIPEDVMLDVRRTMSPWPLERIVRHLHTRFVSPDDHARAETEWRSLSQEPKNGKRLTVQQLETKLRDIADRRIETTITEKKTKFVNQPNFTEQDTYADGNFVPRFV